MGKIDRPQPQFIVYGLTQDAEPCVTPFVLAYADTLEEATEIAKEFSPSRDYGVTIYDRETGEYVDGGN